MRSAGPIEDSASMMSTIEHAALGAALLAAAAIGIARGATYFRRTGGETDRFFATSLVSVVLVALLVGGLFYLTNAVAGTDGAWRLPAALAALGYAVVLPVAAWRTIGPRAADPGPGAIR